ncbi:MAG: SIS domain-containing protein, partial [Dehalococcoidia bacterium]|nr:SIS domain-containing protein [Dehalococcoidia bacterium]
MLKEIEEQPKAIQDTLRERLHDDGRVSLEEFNVPPSVIRNARRIIFLGCGTSFHVGLVGQYMYEPILRIPAQAEVASEYRYRQPIVGPDDLVIAISQS